MGLREVRQNIRDTVFYYEDGIYLVFRVMIGLLWFLHGFSKMQGIFAGKTVLLTSAGTNAILIPGMDQAINLIWFAGVFQFFGGLFIMFGLLTRIASIFGIATMGWAFLISHTPTSLNPTSGGGEMALLYLLLLLMTLINGTKKFGLDNLFFRERKRR